MPSDDQPSPWLSRLKVAKRIDYSEGALANLASKGQGPPFWSPSGTPKYHVALVDQWVLDPNSVPNGKQTGPLRTKTGHPTDAWLVLEHGDHSVFGHRRWSHEKWAVVAESANEWIREVSSTGRTG